MEIKASYTNSNGDTIAFGHESGVYITETELFGSAYAYTESSNRIGSVVRGIREASITFAFIVDDPEQLDELFDVLDYDARENTTGTFTVNDYSIECCFIENAPVLYTHSNIIVRKMNALIQSKFWRKNITQELFPASGASGGFEFPYDYQYDYAPSSSVQTVKVGGKHASDFVMIIYGAITNPAVLIGGHRYKVNVAVPAGGFLAINSEQKTITLVDASGIATNVFNHQDKSSYIFQKIPAGENVVSWVGNDFGFTLSVFEERNEPKWI